jgi:cell division protein FtsA
MSQNISTGIDIGTYQVKVVVASKNRTGDKVVPKIIGTGYAESKGLRHGCILNISDAVKAIKSSVAQAEKTSGTKIKTANISINGIGLGALVSSGQISISRADGEITDIDLTKSIESAQSEISQSYIINRTIIHQFILQHKVDGKVIIGSPVGLKGMRLETKVLFITCLENHLADMIEAVKEAGIQVAEIVAAPIAASLVTLSKTQKMAGCVLANIGSETVSIVVFENETPISLEIFPIGSSDITKDIALGLRISLEEAEEIKKGNIIGISYPRKKLEDIISARLSDIFELIEAHLKKIGRNGLLPAGIIITGGGASIDMIEEMAKNSLHLPSRIGTISLGADNRGGLRDASWSVAYGLAIKPILDEQQDEDKIYGFQIAKKTGARILDWFKQFLP